MTRATIIEDLAFPGWYYQGRYYPVHLALLLTPCPLPPWQCIQGQVQRTGGRGQGQGGRGWGQGQGVAPPGGRGHGAGDRVPLPLLPSSVAPLSPVSVPRLLAPQARHYLHNIIH